MYVHLKSVSKESAQLNFIRRMNIGEATTKNEDWRCMEAGSTEVCMYDYTQVGTNKFKWIRGSANRNLRAPKVFKETTFIWFISIFYFTFIYLFIYLFVFIYICFFIYFLADIWNQNRTVITTISEWNEIKEMIKILALFRLEAAFLFFDSSKSAQKSSIVCTVEKENRASTSCYLHANHHIELSLSLSLSQLIHASFPWLP